ncbi:hydroxyacid dehydrogenase [Aureimonas pseudogalii]|uniref:Phosphoglycerate dehydrogenase-like enzyme n=1 Tax=Aureimonas pseudogalii TaxID=1744844 RepID=A0A7W6EBX1_9HYPH|nr:hydroxyacid dehydrogenase [Aureimonas pseudogalii]MBB3998019.1 phosphoglycerate dehydrogenase-like enzyme [Aureimonas pseudogalii]
MVDLPLVLAVPQPRTLDTIFAPESLAEFQRRYEVLESTPEALASLAPEVLARARYLVGQPAIGDETLAAMTSLRAIVNVEGNFLDNMPYERCFERGIHVLVTSAVFAEPVAELGLGIALSLHRSIAESDAAFRNGTERYGLDGNGSARLISGSTVGIVGFGDLGRAVHRLLAGFGARVTVHDPWLPASILRGHGVAPASLDEVLEGSDTIFVTAAITAENGSLFDAAAFARMREGAAFVLLSRAGIVDFPAMLAAAASGRIKVGTDVFPSEPVAADDPVRLTPNTLLSAHRAGALDIVFQRMGEMVLEDFALMDAGLPPMRAKRAERETVGRMRSQPVSRS